jgi:cytochrome b561/polyisoprenoid-binding protein YceI
MVAEFDFEGPCMHKNTATSYGSIARVLHWLTALIILCSIILGLIAKEAGLRSIDSQILMFSLHKTLGICAILVASLRILWALSQPHPVSLHPERRLETFAAELTHWLLYISMIVVPLAGWAEHAATEGFAPILWPFGQNLPLIPKSGHLAETLAAIHTTFAWILIATIALHVAGALKHQLIDRDAVLGRMLSGQSAGNAAQAIGRKASALCAHAAPAVLAAAIFVAGGAYALATRPEAVTPGETPSLAAVASQWQVSGGAIDFTIKQMGTPVQGNFADWTAAIDFDESSGSGQVTVTINLASLTVGTVTDQAKGAAFFDIANHPTATYHANIRPDAEQGAGHFIAEGTLALKGHEVALNLPFEMTITDGLAEMHGKAQMDRRDWTIGQGYDDEASVAFGVELAVSVQAKR